MKKVLSFLIDGQYCSSDLIWSKLGSIGINSLANSDNGFIVVKLEEKYESMVIEIMKDYFKDSIKEILVNNEDDDHYMVRRNYWTKLSEERCRNASAGLTKSQMLENMFKGTQYERHIEKDMNKSIHVIRMVYEYFVNHENDSKRVQFCSYLLM